MIEPDVPLLSLVSALSMPELGARKDDIHEMTVSKLDAYLSSLTDETKRPAALALRSRLASWTSPHITEEISEAAQDMLLAEGHGEQRGNLREGFAWCEAMTRVHELAHPGSHALSVEVAENALAKLDAYLALVVEESKRTAALALRAAIIAWTPPVPSDAVTQVARAVLAVEDYARFHDGVRELFGLPKRNAGNGT